MSYPDDVSRTRRPDNETALLEINLVLESNGRGIHTGVSARSSLESAGVSPVERRHGRRSAAGRRVGWYDTCNLAAATMLEH